MRTLLLATMGASLLTLAACSDSNDKQPTQATPPAGTESGQTAPTESSPTPQTGTGGASQTTTPSGTQNTQQP
ncbi:hypothetical protein IFT84_19155 [Rhizobium sp. CFBP 8762]|uniref:hypothetical protein n=1 Tax=Rhizobium sp. CFBP 8762 TaxID=2775279 RepID=UPI0017877453|nr:hypothetical protein [Rhizobium sp. CFBP 8762]MBD8556632.1 hypothetical protein [Rhizobium sp. CFBP 8762]